MGIRWLSARLNEVHTADFGVLMDAVELRFIPEANALEVGGPLRISQISDRRDEIRESKLGVQAEPTPAQQPRGPVVRPELFDRVHMTG